MAEPNFSNDALALYEFILGEFHKEENGDLRPPEFHAMVRQKMIGRGWTEERFKAANEEIRRYVTGE